MIVVIDALIRSAASGVELASDSSASKFGHGSLDQQQTARAAHRVWSQRRGADQHAGCRQSAIGAGALFFLKRRRVS